MRPCCQAAASLAFWVRFGGGAGADVTNERARRRTQTPSQVRQAPAKGECRQRGAGGGSQSAWYAAKRRRNKFMALARTEWLTGQLPGLIHLDGSKPPS
jgi:hypothetical protein